MSRSARAILPFIPAKDYDLCLKFYQTLGFEITYSSDALTGFRLGECQFLLQNFYVKGLAENLVLQLLVDDLDSWWEHSQTLPRAYPEVEISAPQEQPWGQRVMNLIDPSGVLWYITQA